MWYETVMFFLEFLAAVCALALCGPCLLSCARRLILGDELLQRGGPVIGEADVLGCNEPSCPYYRKNIRFIMVPTTKRRGYNSPNRQCS